MCLFKKRKILNITVKGQQQVIPVPPAPKISNDAVAFCNEEKKCYYEIYQRESIYYFKVFKLLFDDMEGLIDSYYYWHPVDDGFVHFFDSKYKAIEEAEMVMNNR